MALASVQQIKVHTAFCFDDPASHATRSASSTSLT